MANTNIHPWLSDGAARAFLHQDAHDNVDFPLRWDHAVGRHLARRGTVMGSRNTRLVMAKSDVTLHEPFLAPSFVAAWCRQGGPRGYVSRTGMMRRLFGDIVPEEITNRQQKASFGTVAIGRESRAFLRDWHGEGVDASIVDVAALLPGLRRREPFFRSAAAPAVGLAGVPCARGKAVGPRRPSGCPQQAWGELRVARFLMNGLTVESELPLRGYGCSEAPADVHVRYAGARAVPAEAPGEGQLLQLSRPGLGARCSTVRTEDGGFLARVNGGMDFEISADLRTVDIWLDDSWPAAMMPVLSSCLLMAVLLALRGDYALHASTVELKGRALAFVGGPGAGKSTMAALMCSEGARLLTDDLLRTDFSTGQPVATWVPSRTGSASCPASSVSPIPARVCRGPSTSGCCTARRRVPSCARWSVLCPRSPTARVAARSGAPGRGDGRHGTDRQP